MNLADFPAALKEAYRTDGPLMKAILAYQPKTCPTCGQRTKDA